MLTWLQRLHIGGEKVQAEVITRGNAWAVPSKSRNAAIRAESFRVDCSLCGREFNSKLRLKPHFKSYHIIQKGKEYSRKKGTHSARIDACPVDGCRFVDNRTASVSLV